MLLTFVILPDSILDPFSSFLFLFLSPRVHRSVKFVCLFFLFFL